VLQAAATEKCFLPPIEFCAKYIVSCAFDLDFQATKPHLVIAFVLVNFGADLNQCVIELASIETH